MNMLKQKLENQQRNNLTLMGGNLTNQRLQGVLPSTNSPIKIPATKGDDNNFVNYQQHRKYKLSGAVVTEGKLTFKPVPP